ncbi:helix-turn-helix domain-containing protein [Megasphaera massiliensis]|uniref:helix-turn-helix domain-containing protein n=1 Tax=Megasphaera massiliensis TaxID=1232428 RepID=UPI003AB5BE60
MPRNKLSKFDRELREIISENLKKYAGHLTQGQLSELTGIPASTLSGYFSMRSTPNAGNIQKIADALGLNKSDLDPRFSSEFLKTGDGREVQTAQYGHETAVSHQPLSGNYYNDPSVAKLAEELRIDPNRRILFDATKDLSAEDIEIVLNLINGLKSKDSKK